MALGSQPGYLGEQEGACQVLRAGTLQEPPCSADMSRNPAGSHKFTHCWVRPLLSTSLLESQRAALLYVEDRAAPH